MHLQKCMQHLWKQTGQLGVNEVFKSVSGLCLSFTCMVQEISVLIHQC